MDYETKPTSRKNLRKFAGYLRELFGVSSTGAFPVLEVLDLIRDIFENSGYEIVEDNKLPPQTMAQCSPNDEGGYTIEIKESVYEGARNKKVGAFRGFICHEICHVFLFEIGFTPLFARSFEENKIPAFRSVEWQAKALCGEVMIPYEESRNMGIQEICDKYNVSKAFAVMRKKQEKKERR
ncbi:MAG: ImmA/IrrE family metallo-endopeptidase [Clostridia bacterium]|nr:ImmA/IrrE family metallo-endopeptidase [Clostridia bacterium]